MNLVFFQHIRNLTTALAAYEQKIEVGVATLKEVLHYGKQTSKLAANKQLACFVCL